MIKHSTWTKLGDVVSSGGQWMTVVVALLVAAAILLVGGSLIALWLMDLVGGWIR